MRSQRLLLVLVFFSPLTLFAASSSPRVLHGRYMPIGPFWGGRELISFKGGYEGDFLTPAISASDEQKCQAVREQLPHSYQFVSDLIQITPTSRCSMIFSPGGLYATYYRFLFDIKIAASGDYPRTYAGAPVRILFYKGLSSQDHPKTLPEAEDYIREQILGPNSGAFEYQRQLVEQVTQRLAAQNQPDLGINNYDHLLRIGRIGHWDETPDLAQANLRDVRLKSAKLIDYAVGPDHRGIGFTEETYTVDVEPDTYTVEIK